MATVFVGVIFWFVEVFDAGWVLWHSGARARKLTVIEEDFTGIVLDGNAGAIIGRSDGIDGWISCRNIGMLAAVIYGIGWFWHANGDVAGGIPDAVSGRHTISIDGAVFNSSRAGRVVDAVSCARIALASIARIGGNGGIVYFDAAAVVIDGRGVVIDIVVCPRRNGMGDMGIVEDFELARIVNDRGVIGGAAAGAGWALIDKGSVKVIENQLAAVSDKSAQIDSLTLGRAVRESKCSAVVDFVATERNVIDGRDAAFVIDWIIGARKDDIVIGGNVAAITERSVTRFNFDIVERERAGVLDAVGGEEVEVLERETAVSIVIDEIFAWAIFERDWLVGIVNDGDFTIVDKWMASRNVEAICLDGDVFFGGNFEWSKDEVVGD